MEVSEKEQQSDILKNKGNEFFAKNDFKSAIDFYTQAINHLGIDQPKSSVYLCNRAFCHIKQENFGAALEDSEAAIKADPKNPKGYYRKSSSLFGIGKFRESKQALTQITKVLKIKNNKEVNLKIKQLSKFIKQKEFFESIVYLDDFEKCDESKLVVPDTYQGPSLEMDSQIDQEWIQNLIQYFKDQKKLHKKYVWILLKRVKEVLDKYENIHYVEKEEFEQITVCGDIHGQYYDLINIFQTNGLPTQEKPYLFNGDFVDRGSFSVEVMILLYALKVYNPSCIYLNRGNHESIDLNRMYGFEGEVLAKYCDLTFSLFVHSFNYLPLGHILGKKVLIVHGGVFEQEGVKIEDVQKVQRRQSVPQKGMMCDILWSDPGDLPGRRPNKRGVSIEFGEDVAERFLNENGLELLVRSHQVKDEGYEVTKNQKVITVFSAPKYCDQMTNKGAYIIFKKDLKPNFHVFEAVWHPNIPAMTYAKNSQMMFK